MMLSDVCLSVAYNRPKSRKERSRKTKIGTRDSDTTLKVKVTEGVTYCGGLRHSLFILSSSRQITCSLVMLDMNTYSSVQCRTWQ